MEPQLVLNVILDMSCKVVIANSNVTLDFTMPVEFANHALQSPTASNALVPLNVLHVTMNSLLIKLLDHAKAAPHFAKLVHLAKFVAIVPLLISSWLDPARVNAHPTPTKTM